MAHFNQFDMLNEDFGETGAKKKKSKSKKKNKQPQEAQYQGLDDVVEQSIATLSIARVGPQSQLLDGHLKHEEIDKESKLLKKGRQRDELWRQWVQASIDNTRYQSGKGQPQTFCEVLCSTSALERSVASVVEHAATSSEAKSLQLLLESCLPPSRRVHAAALANTAVQMGKQLQCSNGGGEVSHLARSAFVQVVGLLKTSPKPVTAQAAHSGKQAAHTQAAEIDKQLAAKYHKLSRLEGQQDANTVNILSERAALATDIAALAEQKLDVLTGQVVQEGSGPTPAMVALSVQQLHAVLQQQLSRVDEQEGDARRKGGKAGGRTQAQTRPSHREVALLEQQVKAAEEQVASLEAQLTSWRRQLANLKKQQEILRGTNTNSGAEVAQTSVGAAELRGQVALVEQLEAVLRSDAAAQGAGPNEGSMGSQGGGVGGGTAQEGEQDRAATQLVVAVARQLQTSLAEVSELLKQATFRRERLGNIERLRKGASKLKAKERDAFVANNNKLRDEVKRTLQESLQSSERRVNQVRETVARLYGLVDSYAALPGAVQRQAEMQGIRTVQQELLAAHQNLEDVTLVDKVEVKRPQKDVHKLLQQRANELQAEAAAAMDNGNPPNQNNDLPEH